MNNDCISYYNNKILSFYEDAKKLSQGQIVVPRFVSMWLTTTCNLRCTYCYFNEHNKDKQLADTKKVIKFIDDVADFGIESLEFSGGGEPTIHPDFLIIAKHANDRGLKTGLLTNGHMLDYNSMKFFNYIRIGLDAATSEMYSNIKRVDEAKFAEVLDRIKKFIVERGNYVKRPRVGTKFMINEINYTQINDMIELSKSLKVDYCHFKPTHSDDRHISDGMIVLVDKIFNVMKSKNPNFIIGNMKKVDATVKCFMSPIHVVITQEGNALVCCYFKDNKHIIGNVFDNSFRKIWFSQRHKDIIESIQIDECNRVDCRWNFYNSEMNDILHNGKYDISFI